MAFLTAEELLRVATVPKYGRAKKHSEIANALRVHPLDQWQRPPDERRIERIKQVFSNSATPSLMANPVLLGNSTDAPGRWKVTQMTAGTGTTTSVPGVYVLEIDDSGPKPLWILDGQHRIHGMGLSSQKSQKIPVVILLDNHVYPSPFLAKMFTQVTTEAKPMEPLHGDWMSYAFSMGDYEQPAWRRSMLTTIELVSMPTVDGIQNELLNQIRFNPYPEAGEAGFRTIRWNARQWNEALTKHYFGQSGTHLNPKELARDLIRFIRAVVSLDPHRDGGSRLLDHKAKPHPQLIDALIRAHLEHSVVTGEARSTEEWVSFLNADGRNFGQCDWRLPWITSSGSTSGPAHKPSQKALRLGMSWLFSAPEKLKHFPLAETLKGPGEVLVEAFTRSEKGNKRTKVDVNTYRIAAGSPKFNLSQDGKPRRDIRFANVADSLASVVSIEWRGKQPAMRWGRNDYIDLSTLGASGNTVTLQVETYCYSSDSRQEITLTLLWS